MPTFTIERTFRLPVYRQETYEAADLQAALKMDAENDNWDHSKNDYDCTGPEEVTGAWLGDEAYSGESLV